MKVLMVASEAAPFAKTGGLADVAGSLPGALQRLGHDLAVLLPCYRGIDTAAARRVYDSLTIWLGGSRFDCALLMLPHNGVPFYFLDCPPLYDRAGLYGEEGIDYPDNHIRFAVLARAALSVCRRLFRPHILHCHDWQTGLVPCYMQTVFAADPTLIGIKTLFTIHNLGYHGLFPPAVLPDIGLDASVFRPSGIEFYGKVSFIKGGLAYADALNTVSRGYASEIQTPEHGFGLDGLLRARAKELYGIVNGVDYSSWSPETDPYVAANYSASDLSGKQICKDDLIREFGLPPEARDLPLVGIVSRFTSQKGADLIADVAAELASEELHLVALGTGDPDYEALFLKMALDYPGKIAVRITYDDRLAHKVEAGSDMFLMPSRYEPCGLNQIYSLRYGTIPVVRATGGLDDTIEEGTGFKFQEYSGTAMLKVLRQACAAWHDREGWDAMMRRAMAADFSWRVSAAEYSRLYERLAA